MVSGQHSWPMHGDGFSASSSQALLPRTRLAILPPPPPVPPWRLKKMSQPLLRSPRLLPPPPVPTTSSAVRDARPRSPLPRDTKGGGGLRSSSQHYWWYSDKALKVKGERKGNTECSRSRSFMRSHSGGGGCTRPRSSQIERSRKESGRRSFSRSHRGGGGRKPPRSSRARRSERSRTESGRRERNACRSQGSPWRPNDSEWHSKGSHGDARTDADREQHRFPGEAEGNGSGSSAQHCYPGSGRRGRNACRSQGSPWRSKDCEWHSKGSHGDTRTGSRGDIPKNAERDQRRPAQESQENVTPFDAAGGAISTATISACTNAAKENETDGREVSGGDGFTRPRSEIRENALTSDAAAGANSNKSVTPCAGSRMTDPRDENSPVATSSEDATHVATQVSSEDATHSPTPCAPNPMTDPSSEASTDG
jgi:hypothetical protein